MQIIRKNNDNFFDIPVKKNYFIIFNCIKIFKKNFFAIKDARINFFFIKTIYKKYLKKMK